MRGILIEDGDILIKDGTMVIGDNMIQCVEHIILANRGEYKEYPIIGGECLKMLHGICSRFWSGRVKEMCKTMGIKIKKIEYNNQGQITIRL